MSHETAHEPELDLVAQTFIAEGDDLVERLDAAGLSLPVLVEVINRIRGRLHKISPMRDQPIDYTEWVPSAQVQGNAYNPNHVAENEMQMLKRSIETDGFTQPIVVWPSGGEGKKEVVDGFHRHLVGKQLTQELHGYLPVTQIRAKNTDLPSRMRSTYLHNEASGKPTIPGLSSFVLELSRRGKSDQKIAEDLGMDQDEVLRLRTQTGLGEAFADEEFSAAWEPAGFEVETDTESDEDGDYDPFSLALEGQGPTSDDLNTTTPDEEGRP